MKFLLRFHVYVPEETCDVALALGAGGAHSVRQDAVLRFEFVAEVAVTEVLAFVPEDGNGAVVWPEIRLPAELWGGGGNGG